MSEFYPPLLVALGGVVFFFLHRRDERRWARERLAEETDGAR